MNDSIKQTAFSGNKEDWQRWKRHCAGYKIREFPRNFSTQTNPSKRTRVEATYIVDQDEVNDPTGAAPGERVNRETEAQYQRKCEDYEDIDRKFWAWINERLAGGRAEAIASEYTGFSGLELERLLHAEYDKVTDTAATHKLRKFINTMKTRATKIEDHNKDWLQQMREIEANEMPIAPKMKSSLYLMSLGVEYKVFTAIATQNQGRFTLSQLMKDAQDYNLNQGEDEANNSGVAMQAQQRQGGASKSWSKPCANCSNPYHCQAQCFNQGGGFEHFTSEQRHEWLQNKRRRPNKNMQWKRNQDNEPSEKEKEPESAQVAVLKRKLGELGDKIEKHEQRLFDMGECTLDQVYP